uniref:SET domain-containing protein n=1 Tax=Chromera velia CCMP2878 TaxID=1169474 RepID=A0A0G4HKK8_9ALVE|eukprot:Cvel_28468.t1-p1 / transcript=Cvel_28468.t1 / gene=Cvel_28468 / organism=Chromera_velia_CCMP2878 / gene_product=SET domain-containing protein 5, putative / transcript_product=SET domain-containing protein 5, putative / location=Cvel_scaffold3732:10199-12961(+) / protein_length=519 / sequence_SO=supercontig / SO=protein_coding / is_pseudo=false
MSSPASPPCSISGMTASLGESNASSVAVAQGEQQQAAPLPDNVSEASTAALSSPFEVKEVGLTKGYGLVASRKIKEGELVLSEKALVTGNFTRQLLCRQIACQKLSEFLFVVSLPLTLLYTIVKYLQWNAYHLDWVILGAVCAFCTFMVVLQTFFTWSSATQDAVRAVDDLEEAQRDTFFALWDWRNPTGPTPLGVFESNAIDLMSASKATWKADAETAARKNLCGVFPIGSKLNHSCRANCCTVWNELSNRLEVYALKRVEQGEELTIEYTGPFETFKSRQTTLMTNWGFRCECELCKCTPEERRKSDGNRAELSRLEFSLAMGVYEERNEKELNAAKEKVTRMDLLMTLEGVLEPNVRLVTITDAFELAVMLRDWKLAKHWAQKGVELLERARGPKHPHTLRMKRYMKDPQKALQDQLARMKDMLKARVDLDKLNDAVKKFLEAEKKADDDADASTEVSPGGGDEAEETMNGQPQEGDARVRQRPQKPSKQQKREMHEQKQKGKAGAGAKGEKKKVK